MPKLLACGQAEGIKDTLFHWFSYTPSGSHSIPVFLKIGNTVFEEKAYARLIGNLGDSAHEYITVVQQLASAGRFAQFLTPDRLLHRSMSQHYDEYFSLFNGIDPKTSKHDLLMLLFENNFVCMPDHVEFVSGKAKKLHMQNAINAARRVREDARTSYEALKLQLEKDRAKPDPSQPPQKHNVDRFSTLQEIQQECNYYKLRSHAPLILRPGKKKAGPSVKVLASLNSIKTKHDGKKVVLLQPFDVRTEIQRMYERVKNLSKGRKHKGRDVIAIEDLDRFFEGVGGLPPEVVKAYFQVPKKILYDDDHPMVLKREDGLMQYCGPVQQKLADIPLTRHQKMPTRDRDDFETRNIKKEHDSAPTRKSKAMKSAKPPKSRGRPRVRKIGFALREFGDARSRSTSVASSLETIESNPGPCVLSIMTLLYAVWFAYRVTQVCVTRGPTAAMYEIRTQAAWVIFGGFLLTFLLYFYLPTHVVAASFCVTNQIENDTAKKWIIGSLFPGMFVTWLAWSTFGEFVEVFWYIAYIPRAYFWYVLWPYISYSAWITGLFVGVTIVTLQVQNGLLTECLYACVRLYYRVWRTIAAIKAQLQTIEPNPGPSGRPAKQKQPRKNKGPKQSAQAVVEELKVQAEKAAVAAEAPIEEKEEKKFGDDFGPVGADVPRDATYFWQSPIFDRYSVLPQVERYDILLVVVTLLDQLIAGIDLDPTAPSESSDDESSTETASDLWDIDRTTDSGHSTTFRNARAFPRFRSKKPIDVRRVIGLKQTPFTESALKVIRTILVVAAWVLTQLGSLLDLLIFYDSHSVIVKNHALLRTDYDVRNVNARQTKCLAFDSVADVVAETTRTVLGRDVVWFRKEYHQVPMRMVYELKTTCPLADVKRAIAVAATRLQVGTNINTDMRNPYDNTAVQHEVAVAIIMDGKFRVRQREEWGF